MTMKEVWLPIHDYEGLYEVSNLGRVKGLKRNHILKHGMNNSGYKMVTLWKNNKGNSQMIHRLVAKTFLPYSDGLVVNHIDENKLNNCLDNLEWCTQRENVNHGTGIQRRIISLGKVVTNGIDTYCNVNEAGRQTKLDPAGIRRCANGTSKTCGGYHWRYV